MGYTRRIRQTEKWFTRNQGDGTVDVVVQNDKTLAHRYVTAYAMGVVGVETDSSEIKYTGLYIRKDKEARIVQGYDSSDSADVREIIWIFYEREIINHQFNYNKTFENNWTIDVIWGMEELKILIMKELLSMKMEWRQVCMMLIRVG